MLSTTPNYSLLKAAITGAEAQSLDQSDLASLLIPMLQPDDQELDTHQAAAFLGRATSTLENWRCQGKGPNYRKDENGLIRYRIGWLKDWHNQGEVVGTEESVI